MLKESKHSVVVLSTTRLSGQTVSGERQRAVSGNALEHLAVRAGPLW